MSPLPQPRSRGEKIRVPGNQVDETPAKLICYNSLLVDVSLLEKETAKISPQWKFQSIRDVKFISANLKKSPIRKNFILYGVVFNMQRNMLTN